MAEIDLGKVVGPQGEPGIKGDTGKEGPQGPPGPEGVVDGNSAITFSTPAAYEEPISGNSIAVLFGRFKRWISNLQDNLGQLNSLKTPDKSSAVSAVNANYDSIAQLEQDVGNPTDLTTTSKEVVGAVNELNSALSSTTSALTNRFECGSLVIKGKSGEWSFVSVTFAHHHKTPPVVVASHASANVAQCACTIQNRTVTGFVIGVYNTTVQTAFNWIAIELN